MLIISIFFFIFTNALTQRKDIAISYSRITILILLLCSLLAYDNLYFTTSDQEIPLYGGMYTFSFLTLEFNIFIYLLSSIILIFFETHKYIKTWTNKEKLLKKIDTISVLKPYQTTIIILVFFKMPLYLYAKSLDITTLPIIVASSLIIYLCIEYSMSRTPTKKQILLRFILCISLIVIIQYTSLLYYITLILYINLGIENKVLLEFIMSTTITIITLIPGIITIITLPMQYLFENIYEPLSNLRAIHSSNSKTTTSKNFVIWSPTDNTDRIARSNQYRNILPRTNQDSTITPRTNQDSNRRSLINQDRQRASFFQTYRNVLLRSRLSRNEMWDRLGSPWPHEIFPNQLFDNDVYRYNNIHTGGLSGLLALNPVLQNALMHIASISPSERFITVTRENLRGPLPDIPHIYSRVNLTHLADLIESEYIAQGDRTITPSALGLRRYCFGYTVLRNVAEWIIELRTLQNPNLLRFANEIIETNLRRRPHINIYRAHPGRQPETITTEVTTFMRSAQSEIERRLQVYDHAARIRFHQNMLTYQNAIRTVRR